MEGTDQDVVDGRDVGSEGIVVRRDVDSKGWTSIGRDVRVGSGW